VGPKASLDGLEKRGISGLCRQSNHGSSAVHSVAYVLYRLSSIVRFHFANLPSLSNSVLSGASRQRKEEKVSPTAEAFSALHLRTEFFIVRNSSFYVNVNACILMKSVAFFNLVMQITKVL